MIHADLLSWRQLALGRVLYPPDTEWRPEPGEECPESRPCPYVGCRYHLYLDVLASGAIRYNFPALEPTDLVETCAIDVAIEGMHTPEEVGAAVGLSTRRVQQIEARALRKLQAHRAELLGGRQ